MLKASAGGGGKGMRLVDDETKFVAAYQGAQREAKSAFGDDAVYLEKAVIRPRHVEIQVFADTHGNVRPPVRARLLDPAPPPEGDRGGALAGGDAGAARARWARSRCKRGRAVGYVGAGTCEFLLAEDGSFYFLEMNTRLQVEHPVTEMITQRDLVHLQIAVANGEPLPFKQEDLQRARRGHRVPHLRRGPAQVPAVAGQDHAAAPAAGPVRARRLGRLRGLRDQRLLRPDDLEADRLGRRRAPRRSSAWRARSPSIASAASRPTWRSTAASCASPTSAPAGIRRRTSRGTRPSCSRPLELEENDDALDAALTAAALHALEVAPQATTGHDVAAASERSAWQRTISH